MKKIYLALITILLINTACSVKRGFFSEDKLYQKALIHSKQGAIYNSLELKASIIATHLNSFLKECKNCMSERFLVAIYISDDSSDKRKQGIHNTYYKLTMNGKEPISIKELSYDDDLIKLAPFRNRWAHYYVIDFPRDNQNKLKLKYESKSYGSTTLEFESLQEKI